MLTSTRGPVCRALCASTRTEFESKAGQLLSELMPAGSDFTHGSFVVTAYVPAGLAVELANKPNTDAHSGRSSGAVCTSRLWGLEAPTVKLLPIEARARFVRATK